jgi:hypothetical protein
MVNSQESSFTTCTSLSGMLQGPFTSLVLGPAERYDIIIDLSGEMMNICE